MSSTEYLFLVFVACRKLLKYVLHCSNVSVCCGSLFFCSEANLFLVKYFYFAVCLLLQLMLLSKFIIMQVSGSIN